MLWTNIFFLLTLTRLSFSDDHDDYMLDKFSVERRLGGDQINFKIARPLDFSKYCDRFNATRSTIVKMSSGTGGMGGGLAVIGRRFMPRPRPVMTPVCRCPPDKPTLTNDAYEEYAECKGFNSGE